MRLDPSLPWDSATKRWVATIGLVIAGALLYRVRQILPILALSTLLAYLLTQPWTALAGGLDRARAEH